MSHNPFHFLVLFALIGLTALACAGPGLPTSSSRSDVVAGAAFMRGRILELEGRLLEAAEAYELAAQ